jgi:hypothetical protein
MSIPIKLIFLLCLFCFSPSFLHAQEIGHALSGLPSLFGAFLLLFTAIFIIANFAKNNGLLCFITLFLSVVTLIYFVKLGENFTTFNFTGIFTSIIGLISVLKYLRYRS